MPQPNGGKAEKVQGTYFVASKLSAINTWGRWARGFE